MKVTVTVPEETQGKRVDVFLAEFLENTTRSAAQRLLNDGLVCRNDKVVPKNYRVNAGDVLECQIPEPEPYQAVAQNIPIDIVYEDSDLLVINKPQGLVVHPGAGNYDGTLVNALLYYCGDSLSGVGGVLRPGIVHRLDKDTSGLMVVAKNDLAHQALAGQLAERSMRRVYNAVCIGNTKKDEFTVDLPIGRHSVDRKKMAVLTAHGSRTRRAVTRVTVLERFKGYSLIEARLETGRTHQIRVHLSHLGYPVLGDEVYGRGVKSLNGQLLHAVSIEFVHPVSGEVMAFSSDWPSHFQKVVERLR